MIDELFSGLTLISALGCGLIAGVFFAFSSFVMKGLARLPAGEGIAVMNSINVVAVSPAFMIALFGTAAGCTALAVYSLWRLREPGAILILGGSLLYLFGAILVTIVFHVPRNDALAAVNPASADAARLWSEYVIAWTAWNHVRTVTALAAGAALTIAIVAGKKG